jgi:HTH-type transcriptional regulator / antitoxin HigA
MLATRIQQVTTVWPSLSGVVYVPHTDREYQETVGLLDSLIDQVGEDETHPFASLMEVLGVLIEKYEDDHVPEITEV